MNMARRNILAGSLLLVVAVCYGWLTTSVPSRDIMPNTPGPTFFPWIICIFLAILSLMLVFQGLVKSTTTENTQSAGELSRNMLMGLIVFFFYLLFLPYVGFLIASAPFVAIFVWLFGCRKVWQILACSLGLTIFTYVLFRYGFQVILPRGPFSF